MSLSSRRAWIEIIGAWECIYGVSGRSPHGERGLKSDFDKITCFKRLCKVALLTESVDWNINCYTEPLKSWFVALLTESVDWNQKIVNRTNKAPTSLSSRRAWIEMSLKLETKFLVASLSSRRAWIEIMVQAKFWIDHRKSLSSRRAWIEIKSPHQTSFWNQSLSSRRAWIEIFFKNFCIINRISRSPHGERGLKFCHGVGHLCELGRSPHGERGLKLNGLMIKVIYTMSLSSRRAWIEMDIYNCYDNCYDVALLTESVDWNCWLI